jgi:hypothetical protein
MKKGWKPFPTNNNLIQDSEGHEVPGSNKTKINDDKESNNFHKNILKKEILQVIIENFTEMLPDMVNQKA